ncbi:unnamed protein product [Moneuplotes crassus]|uniref:Uncharacterized protein n=1 Tax=Euplotes crassus TaxID=5936 RepID=A0AAD1Y9L9_EUPCR|nr:unnamed protein product [Moneuplotes crassus]
MDAPHEEVDTKDLMSKKLAELKKREKQIQKDSARIDTQICVNLYLNIKKFRRGFQPIWDLYFEVNLSRYCKILKQLSRFVMPPESKFSFCNQPLAGCHVKEFLSKSIPPRIQEICATSSRFDKSPSYFNLILRACMYTIADASLDGFKNLNMKQLKRMFSANKHTKSLTIFNCSLRLPACPDFSDCFRGTTLSELKLCYIKVESRNEEEEHLHELDGLISGLSKSPDLHKSIKIIQIFPSGTFKEQSNQTLVKYGFPFY